MKNKNWISVLLIIVCVVGYYGYRALDLARTDTTAPKIEINKERVEEIWQMLSITMAFVSSLTTKGDISQHQSPSRKTQQGSFFCRVRQTVVFPTPIVPPMR